jgi:hypothetical protein
MKLLRATTKSQGEVPGDFAFVPEGELVFLGSVCDTDLIKGSAGIGSCGCARSFTGLTSQKGTTTALVEESTMSEAELADRIHEHLVAGGWGGVPELPRMARDLAAEVVETATPHPAGTVVGRSFDDLLVRR